MINYSLVTRASEPGKINAAKRVYPIAQYAELITLDEFADHIASHGTTFDSGTIHGVLKTMVKCLREELLLGNRVQLGDLGTFSLSLSSKGCESAETFSDSCITAVRTAWYRGKTFGNLRKDARFQYVGSRKAQRAARIAERTGIDTGLGHTPGGSTGNGGTGSGSLED